ncbi:MAG: hypothetical protein ABH856_00155 [Patescibacteria group bacterium]|nr:hypothetical protein [Patescibacteria group bacterium]
MLTLKSVSIGIGLLLVIIYLPFVFNYKAWKKEGLEFLGDKKIVRLCGLLMMLMAFLMLRVHSTFEWAWPVAVSIMGWMLLLKGLIWFWFPGWVKKFASTFMAKHEWALVIGGLIGLGIGVLYEYLGFYMF